MAQVDHEDDSIWRWVIQHYRFDSTRHERRNVVVAAFDNEDEFAAELDRYGAMIRDEVAAGQRSSREGVSGVVLKPGELEEAARGRNVRRALEHGVSWVQAQTLGPRPTNMAVLTSENYAATPEAIER